MNLQASEPAPDPPAFQPYVAEGFVPSLHVALESIEDPFDFCPQFATTAATEFSGLALARRHEVQQLCHELFRTDRHAGEATRVALLYRIQRAINQCDSNPAAIWSLHFQDFVTSRGFRDWFLTGKIQNTKLALLTKYFPVGDPTEDELDFAAFRIATGRVHSLLVGKKRSTGGRMKYPTVKFPSVQELIFLDGAHKLHDPTDIQLEEVARMAHLHEVRKEKRWKSMWAVWGPPFRIIGHALRLLERDSHIKLGSDAGE